MKKSIFLLVTVLIAATMLVPLNGCTVDDTQESNTFIELLKLVPAETLSKENMILINYERIWENSGVSFYKEDGSKMNREEILDVLLSITYSIPGDDAFIYSSYFSGLDRNLPSSPIQTDTLGYTPVVDVHAEILQGYSYKSFKMVAMIGDFSIQATSNALQNQDAWPEGAVSAFTTESYLNVPVYSWGDNSSFDVYSPPHIDRYGLARPLAVMDGYMFIGDSVDMVKGMISSVKDETSSLADVPEYALIAEHMDSLGVFAVMMSDAWHENDPVYVFSLPLGQYLGLGYGDAYDEQGEYTAVITVYENGDMAAENADILKEELEQYTPPEPGSIYYEAKKDFDLFDIQCDGRVLIAKLYVNENTPGYYWKVISGVLN